MIKSINFDGFIYEFERMGRGNQFTRSGLLGLWEQLEEYEDAMGEAIELDVIALCCEFTEYEDLTEAIEACTDLSEYLEEDGTLMDDEALDYLQSNTEARVLDNGGVLVRNF
jgi:hypothetical protein